MSDQETTPQDNINEDKMEVQVEKEITSAENAPDDNSTQNVEKVQLEGIGMTIFDILKYTK